MYVESFCLFSSLFRSICLSLHTYPHARVHPDPPVHPQKEKREKKKVIVVYIVIEAANTYLSRPIAPRPSSLTVVPRSS